MDPAYLVPGLAGGVIGAALAWLNAAAEVAAARRTASRLGSRASDELTHLSTTHQRGWREQSSRRERESGRWVEEGRHKINTRSIELSARVRRLDQQADAFDTRTAELKELERQLDAERAELERREERLAALRASSLAGLLEASGQTEEQARESVRAEVLRGLEEEQVRATTRRLDALDGWAQRKARAVIGIAVGRCTVSHAHPASPSIVTLPGPTEEGGEPPVIDVESFRGMVASLLDAQLLHDEQARTIQISSADGVTREVARRSVEQLIAEGGDPELATIAALEAVEPDLVSAARGALARLHLPDEFPEPLIKTLGRMRYRTSYGQNVLYHSVEVAMLCAGVAAEIGLDVQTALRAGLFHDLGKAIDHDRDEGHPELGARLLQEHGMPQDVVEAARSHHSEPRTQPMYSLLVCAADTISAARLGARRESFEQYVRRLERLEMIANSHAGVTTSYAIQAGRALRVLVDPEEISDARAAELAKEIASEIHEQLDFPGKVRVTVIRERRVIEYAR